MESSRPPAAGSKASPRNAWHSSLAEEYTEQRIQQIEAAENQLIQHIRTAGLQKQRENGLVEEVMELRKLRRQLVVHFRRAQAEAHAQVSTCSVFAFVLAMYGDSYNEQHEAEVEGMVRDAATIDETRQKYEAVILGIKAKAAEQAQFFSEQIKAMEAVRRQELEEKQTEMRRVHEQKLQLLEQQIRLLSEKQASERTRRDMQILASVEEERRAWQAKEVQHQQEINALLTKLAQAQRHMDTLSQQLQQSMQQARELEAQRTSETSAWEERMKEQRQQHEAAMEQSRVTHEQALAAIDDKVRKALHNREQSIQQLKAQLRQRDEQLQSAEGLLQQLHQGFSGLR